MAPLCTVGLNLLWFALSEAAPCSAACPLDLQFVCMGCLPKLVAEPGSVCLSLQHSRSWGLHPAQPRALWNLRARARCQRVRPFEFVRPVAQAGDWFNNEDDPLFDLVYLAPVGHPAFNPKDQMHGQQAQTNTAQHKVNHPRKRLNTHRAANTDSTKSTRTCTQARVHFMEGLRRVPARAAPLQAAAQGLRVQLGWARDRRKDPGKTQVLFGALRPHRVLL